MKYFFRVYFIQWIKNFISLVKTSGILLGIFLPILVLLYIAIIKQKSFFLILNDNNFLIRIFTIGSFALTSFFSFIPKQLFNFSFLTYRIKLKIYFFYILTVFQVLLPKILFLIIFIFPFYYYNFGINIMLLDIFFGFFIAITIYFIKQLINIIVAIISCFGLVAIYWYNITLFAIILLFFLLMILFLIYYNLYKFLGKQLNKRNKRLNLNISYSFPIIKLFFIELIFRKEQLSSFITGIILIFVCTNYFLINQKEFLKIEIASIAISISNFIFLLGLFEQMDHFNWKSILIISLKDSSYFKFFHLIIIIFSQLLSIGYYLILIINGKYDLLFLSFIISNSICFYFLTRFFSSNKSCIPRGLIFILEYSILVVIQLFILPVFIPVLLIILLYRFFKIKNNFWSFLWRKANAESK